MRDARGDAACEVEIQQVLWPEYARQVPPEVVQRQHIGAEVPEVVVRERGRDDGVHPTGVHRLLADEEVLLHEPRIEGVPTGEHEGVGAHDAPQHPLALHVRQRGWRAAVVIRRRGPVVVPVVAEASRTTGRAVAEEAPAVLEASQVSRDDAGR